MLAETDHVLMKPLPNLASEGEAAAHAFGYMHAGSHHQKVVELVNPEGSWRDLQVREPPRPPPGRHRAPPLSTAEAVCLTRTLSHSRSLASGLVAPRSPSDRRRSSSSSATSRRSRRDGSTTREPDDL